MNLQQQKRELDLDSLEIANQRRAAKAEETRLRDLVENYGQRAERPALEQQRAHLEALDVRERETEAKREKLLIDLGREGWLEGRINSISREHQTLTSEQLGKLRGMLTEGKELKDVRALARKWSGEVEQQSRGANHYSFNSKDGVNW